MCSAVKADEGNGFSPPLSHSINPRYQLIAYITLMPKENCIVNCASLPCQVLNDWCLREMLFFFHPNMHYTTDWTYVDDITDHLDSINYLSRAA